MPLYRYDAFDRKGIKKTGTLDVSSPAAAKEVLRTQGLMPIAMAEVSYESNTSLWSQLSEAPVQPKSVIVFTKQLAVLSRSAVPLLQALELLIEQFEGRFKRILIKIKDGVKSGEPFAKELAKHPKIFSNVYVQLVKAGEASGKLDGILDRLTEYLERSAETKTRINKAIQKPLITIIAAIAVLGLMLVLVVPGITEVLTKMGKELPMQTRILIALSDFLKNNAKEFAVMLAGLILWFSYWRTTQSGRYKIDELLLRFPLTAYFSKTKAVVQFSKTLGMLLESGVNLSEALNIVCAVVENAVLARQLSTARDKIIKEGKIARYLKETGMFPNIALYMIGTGEQSGKLGQMLLVVGNDYDVELSNLTDKMVESINPVLTMVMGGMVLFIVMAIMLPMLSMSDVKSFR